MIKNLCTTKHFIAFLTVGFFLSTLLFTANPPALKWVRGTIYQILIQPKENFYVVSIKSADGEVMVRFANPYTGEKIAINAANPAYDLLKEAFFRKLPVQVGYRDFGNDPQSGIRKLCIDRVSLDQ